MKNKTEQLKELFQKWYSEQEKSDFENSNHFSVDGLIKADDEDCVVLFVLAEPHSTEDHKYNPVFWFRRIWEDYDELCKDSGRNAKAGIKSILSTSIKEFQTLIVSIKGLISFSKPKYNCGII